MSSIERVPEDEWQPVRTDDGKWVLRHTFILAYPHPLLKLGPFDTREQAQATLEDWRSTHAT